MAPLLDDLLDSWDRNNTILVNRLRALPEDSLAIRPMADSPSVGELFSHIHEEAGPLTWGVWMKKRTRS